MSTYPGTAIEVLELKKGSSKILFDGIFATGGITLSQLSTMTGLEPHVIQNWVKRRFVASPVKKLYSKQQFARVIIINMLRETLQIDAICNLISVIGGDVEDTTDDLIGDDELYHRYVDMIAEENIDVSDSDAIYAVVKKATEDFTPRVAGDKLKLQRILQVMLYARASAQLRDNAKEILAMLD